MYLELMILVILAVPISVIYKLILQKVPPYAAIGAGTIFASIGCLLVFLMAMVSGDSIGAFVEESIDAAVNIIVNNKEMLEAVGMADMEKAKAIAALNQMYSSIAALLPAVLITISAIVSYVEYNLLVRLRYRKIDNYKPLAYIRNFALKQNDVMGWFLIYLAAYLVSFTGVSAGEVMVMNVSVLVEMIMSLQGISLVFLYAYANRIPKAVPVIGVIVAWMFPIGKTILFTLGIFDLLMNLRGRVRK